MPQKRSKSLKIARNRSKSLEIARNRSNLASADVTLQLRLGFWPVKSGQCSNVLPIVSVVGPNYQFQLLPTLNSMFLEILTPTPSTLPRTCTPLGQQCMYTIRVCILLVLLVLQLYYIFDSALVEVAVGGVSLSMYCVVCASHA